MSVIRLRPAKGKARSAFVPPPVENVKYESGRLTLPGAGWTPQEIERFTTQLRAANVDVKSASGQFVLSHRMPSATANGSKP